MELVKKLKNIISENWPVICIFLMWAVVVVANYQPGTWLIGWDSLLPEFNFRLNITRSLIGAWQEYQGLGITGGMAHSADLVRQLFLWLLSLALPADLLRYSWHFLMLLAGPVGVYFLSLHLFRSFSTFRKPASFLAAFFYLFNLATVQYFYVPYEAFSSFYGFLPWVIFGFINYLEKPSLKTLLLIAGIVLLSTPAYYVQTLFVVVLAVLGTFSLGHLYYSQAGLKKNILVNLRGYLALGVVNLFWLLPVLYFTLTAVSHTTQSKQNLLSTPEVRLQNEGAGSLSNIVTLKGYWFEYLDQDVGTGETVYLLNAWRNHVQEPPVFVVGVVLFTLSLAGLIIYLREDKQKWQSRSLLAIFLVSLVMLTGGNGAFGWPYRFASDYLPLFSQIFRTSFTKWSMVTALCLSLGLGMISAWIYRLMKKIQVSHFLAGSFVLLFLLLGSLYISFPIIEGKLFYEPMKLEIPQEYFELFEYLQAQDSSRRIVHLPAISLWGWQFNDWGYRGSGFLWYGVEQPILDRNFDVWGPTNEQFYQELSYALNSEDPALLKQLVLKYDVSYALIDSSIVNFSTANLRQSTNQQKQQIESIGGELEWSEGSLELYSFDVINEKQGFVKTYSEIALIDSSSIEGHRDVIFDTVGNYVLTERSNKSFPFTGLHQIQPNTGEMQIRKVFKLQPDLYREIVFNGLLEGRVYAGPAAISYFANVLAISFKSPGFIEANDVAVDFPRPKKIEVEIIQEIESLGIDLNGQYISIDSGKTEEVWIDGLIIGEEVPLKYFDAELATIENGTVEVDRSEAIVSNIATDVWTDTIVARKFPLNKEVDQVSLTLKVNHYPIQLPQIEGFNCDPFQRGSVNTSKTESGYLFETKDFGSLCMGIKFSGTRTSQNYWLNLSGRNFNGRSLKFFMEDIERRRAVIDELTPESQYTQSYFLPSSLQSLDGEYSINLNTRSLSGEYAANQLESIDLIAPSLPLEWIEGIFLQSLDGSEQSFNQDALIIEGVEKFGTGFYKLQLKSVDERDGWLSLSQSYDPGWIAINFDGFSNLSLLEHFLENSWKNGWLVSSETERLYLAYLPQLLQFAGYTFMFSGLFYLSLTAFQEKRQE